jgi:general secretion pathway protein M
MISRLRPWWLGLGRRERAMIAGALVVVALGVVYAVAIEPAWLTRARITREMPDLQRQLVQVQALREEVRQLRQQGFGGQSLEALRAAAQSSVERAGLSATVRTQGERAIVVSARSVPAATWFAWMEQFGREARVRVAFARVTRAGLPGEVEAETGFEIPAL